MAVPDTDAAKATAVRELIPYDGSVDSFVELAELVVSEDVTPFVNPAYSSDRTWMITKYLAAHYIAVTTERGAVSQGVIGDARESQRITVHEGLGMTRFGQTAMALDTSGRLTLLHQTALIPPRQQSAGEIAAAGKVALFEVI